MAFIFKSCMLFSMLTALSSAFPFYQAVCDKAALTKGADAWVAALTAGSTDPINSLLTPNYTYAENNKAATASAGILKKALKIDHRRTNYDLVTCATYTELIAAAGPYVLGTQLRHDADGKINGIDSIISTTNSWIFNATKTLEYVQKEKWDPIPVDKQDPREVIQAAGDAYLDMWSDANADKKVPWGTPCTRLEGSAYTGKGAADDSCKPGIPSNHNQAPNTHRRYVIDVEMGSVSIFCVWEHMMNAADSHEFRLENGKLRYVHTMTECGGKTCKL